jgi:hydroxymethylglutaryl-CoA synthase
MTLPDLHQDAVVLGQCLNQTNYRTRYQKDIARIYVGTSSIDSSKPIASFLLALMEEKFGENCWLNVTW